MERKWRIIISKTFGDYENRVPEFLIKCGLTPSIAKSIGALGAKLICSPSFNEEDRPDIQINFKELGVVFYDVDDECWYGIDHPTAFLVAHILNEVFISPFDSGLGE